MSNKTKIAVITDTGERFESILEAAKAEGSSHHLIRSKIDQGIYHCPDLEPKPVLKKWLGHETEQLKLNRACNSLLPTSNHILWHGCRRRDLKLRSKKMNTQTLVQPDPDFLINRQGVEIPKSEIEPSEVLKDEIVREKFAKMLELRALLAEFKTSSFNDLTDFLELSASKYDVKYGGQKGNVNLTSYDGKIKIQVSQQENISYNEDIHSAKTLIDEWFNEGYKAIEQGIDKENENALGSLKSQKMLIDSFFQVGKQGKISHSNMLKLMGYPINDAKWKKAMSAIRASQNIDPSTTHLRFYQKDENGQEQYLSLDFASL